MWARALQPSWPRGRPWWPYRHLPNVLFVHFCHLLNDLDGQMRAVARFLNVPIEEATWPTLVDRATFKTMKANAENVVAGGGDFLVGGARRFLHRGTNGRWRGVLTPDELAQYEQATIVQLDIVGVSSPVVCNRQGVIVHARRSTFR